MGGWVGEGMGGKVGLPHLCAPDRDGSSHLSPGDGLGCRGRRAPAGPIPIPSRGGGRGAAVLRGEAAAGPEARELRERGAAPGVAAAASQPEDRQQVGQREKTSKEPAAKYTCKYTHTHTHICSCQPQTALALRTSAAGGNTPRL